MKRIIVCAALAVAICALIAGAGSKGTHVSPYLLWGDWQFVLNIDPTSPDFGQMKEYGTGIATLRGKVTVEGGGHVNMETGVYSGSGVATDASGDQTFWWIEDMIIPTAVVHIDGGTGRFVGAIGELTNFETTEQVVDEQWPYQITTCKLTAKGWLSF